MQQAKTWKRHTALGLTLSGILQTLVRRPSSPGRQN